MMTWSETIAYIRNKPEYSDLVRLAYFEKDLQLNVERYSKSEEFLETLKILAKHAPGAKRLLDVGCGAGFSSVAFALKGYNVTSLEPDPDDTIGYGAIEKLAKLYSVKIAIEPSYFESNQLQSETFDVVYARQSMHHAADLEKYIAEAYRLLSKGGVLLTVRDHVIYSDKDKEAFLQAHPLHHFYGGENAFSESEYRNAIIKAGFTLHTMWRYYDNVINFFPVTKQQVKKAAIRDRILFFRSKALNETNIPGRMYSFLAIK